MKSIYYIPSEKTIAECKHALGEQEKWFRFIEDDLGRVLIQCTWFEMKSNQISALESAAEVLDEGYAVQNTPERTFQPYGIALSGKLWVAHRKGHDHHIFDLEDEGVTLSWEDASKFTLTPQHLELRKFVLVGEGNALRNTRRWIKRKLTDGNKKFQLRDLEEIRKRANKHAFNVLAVVSGGVVVDIGKTIPVIVSGRLAPPSITVQLLQEFTVVDTKGLCKSVQTPTPLVNVLNQVHEHVNETAFGK